MLRPVFWSLHSHIQVFPVKLEFHWPKQVWAIDAWWSGLWACQCSSQLQGTGCVTVCPKPGICTTLRWLPRTSWVGHHCFWWLSIFIRPGTLHHVTWMAHMIYGIKMYLFRNQFWLTAKEVTGLKHFTTFTRILYIKAWFVAPSAIDAPAGDLVLLKGLVSYPNSEIAKDTSKKLANHLWYLSKELA